jgi:guanylate cyclase soluble subunit beta
MEGQFLVRQIYEDEITYNLINAAVDVLRKLSPNVLFVFTDAANHVLLGQ